LILNTQLDSAHSILTGEAVTPIGNELRAPAVTADDRSPEPRAVPTRSDADSQSPASEYLVYEIDAHGILVQVSANWNEFALANGRPGLRSRQRLGAAFEGLFGDPATVEAQRRITARCAKRGQRGTFLFRSDAPAARKLMMMWVDPLPGGGFRFTSRVLEPGELGEHIYKRLLQVANQPMVARCDSCRRYRWLGSWLDLNDCLVDPKTLRPNAIFRHTICPDCRSTQHGLPLAVV
jgi:hypothetical protein